MAGLEPGPIWWQAVTLTNRLTGDANSTLFSYFYSRLTRGNQVYNFPIHLCDEVLPSPIFYGTVAPVVAWVIVRRLIVEPYVQQQKAQDIERHRAMHHAQ